MNHLIAAARRDAGIEQAEDHANAVENNWSITAYSHLEAFCRARRGEKFMVEDLRAFAEARGFTSPTTEKAWGAVIRRAAGNGLIRKVGYAPAKSSNLSPKCQWEAA